MKKYLLPFCLLAFLGADDGGCKKSKPTEEEKRQEISNELDRELKFVKKNGLCFAVYYDDYYLSGYTYKAVGFTNVPCEALGEM